MTGTMTCPHCGKTIECTAEDIEAFASDADVEAECPYCHKAFQVEMPPMPKPKSKLVFTQPSYQSMRNMGQIPSYPSCGEQLQRPKVSPRVNPARGMTLNPKPDTSASDYGENTFWKKHIYTLVFLAVIVVIFIIKHYADQQAEEKARRIIERDEKELKKALRQFEFEQKYPWATEEGLRELSY